MIVSLHRAARRRLTRLRGQDTSEDAGFAMVFVLLVTMLITIGVTSAMVVTAGNVVPAKHNQDDVTALAAAQAGLEDYLAYLNDNCATFNGSTCNKINGTPTTATVKGTDNVGTETYVRTVLNPSSYLGDGFLRVQSTGRAMAGTTVTAAKTLVADLAGLPNVLRFAYLSKYETLADAFVRSYYPVRTVAITNAASGTAADKASPAVTSGSTVSWAAPTGTDICDKLWYDDSANATDPAEANSAGAIADPAYQSPGRGTLRTYRTSLPVGADWSQSSSSAAATMYQPCEVTFTSGMTFTGPVYSKDALYLSYGTTGGTGPKFTVPTQETLPPVSTGWRPDSFPGAIPGQLYRQFPYILGAPSTDSTFAASNNTVQTSAYDLQLPTDVVDAAGSATCIYTGPTRVIVAGATATIISPLTTATGSGPCYTNTDSAVSSPISATGVTSAQVPVGTTTIYVQNKGTGATSINGSAASPIFSLSTPSSTTNAVNGTPTVTATDAGYTPSTLDLLTPPSGHADGAWTPQWTAYSALNIPIGCSGLLGLNGTAGLTGSRDLQYFNCTVPRTAHPTPSFSDTYSYVKYWVENALAASPSNYTTLSQLQTLVGSLTSPGNSSDYQASFPNSASNTSHRYIATAVADSTTTDGCTPQITTRTGIPVPVPVPAAPSAMSDKFLSKATTGYVTPTTRSITTCMTATVALQIGMKTSATGSNPSSCNQNNCGWGDGVTLNATIPQFTVTAKVVSPSTSSVTTSTVVAFPDGQDATQYATWDGSKTNAPGDLYVEGTGITGKLSLVAQNDAVVTGPLTTSTTTGFNALGEKSWTGGGAVSLVAKNNVRIYHPVSCAATSAATTAGYCANDITGLYSGSLETNGVLATTHPAMQYCNLTTGSSANSLNANCSAAPPTATGTGAVSEIDAAVFALNGSLMTDNFNRGLPMGTSTVVGSILQMHRGATGQQWEAQPADTSRASSGYSLQDSYLALDSSGLPYVPALKSGKRDRSWNIVSFSAGS